MHQSFDNQSERFINAITEPVQCRIFINNKEIEKPQERWLNMGHFMQWMTNHTESGVVIGSEDLDINPDAVILEFWLDGEPPKGHAKQIQDEYQKWLKQQDGK